MNAHTPFPATRTHNGVSLPRLPWDVDAPEPQAERKVTVMPATIRKVVRPVLRAAPKPEADPACKIVALPGEDYEAAYARTLREDAGGASQPKTPASTNKHVEAGKIGGKMRRESEAYLARRDLVVSLVAPNGSTLCDIANKYGKSKGALSEMLPELVKAGRLDRRKVKNVYIYTVADHG